MNSRNSSAALLRRTSRWCRTALLGAGLALVGTSNAQVSAYTFAQTSSSYSAITGGTNIPSSDAAVLDDNVAGALSIGFTFTYNGTPYTQFGYNANGWISMGASAPTSSLLPISGGTTNNIISAFGVDLIGRQHFVVNRTTGTATLTVTAGNTANIVIGSAISGTGIPSGATVSSVTPTTITLSANATSTGTGSHARVYGTSTGIRYQTIGTSPNRTLVVQWTNFSRYTTTASNGDNLNFQIRLNESTNTIDIVYGVTTPTSAGTITPQVGLRGAANTDFNNRTTTTNWAATTAGGVNTATCNYSNTVSPPSGQLYTWTPPAPCTGTPNAGSASTPVVVCPGNTAVLNATGLSGGASGLSFQWQESPNGVTGWASVVGGTGANTASYTTTAINATRYFRLQTTCSTGPTTNETNVVTVNPNLTYAVFNGTSYAESFESWSNQCNTTDVPSLSWRNTPATGNNSWRRNDQGASAAWGNATLGIYSPVATVGSTSARFHSYQASGSSKGNLDLYIDMSAGSGSNGLTFDYINTNGGDSLTILQSTDGGATFVRLGSLLTTAATWTNVSRTITSTSPTTVIRLRATSDFGTTDIGVDNLQITSPCSGTPSAGTAVANPVSLCAGAATALSNPSPTVASGIVYQWYRTTTSGTGYTPVSGAASPSATSGALTAGTYFFLMSTKCTISGDSSLTTEVTVTVNPVPVVSASNDGPVCVGGSVALDGTTDIPGTYTWSGPNSFAATTEDASVSPIVAASGGVYTFNVTAAGCPSLPATTTVVVNPIIYASAATATPDPICNGGTSTLSISAGTTAAYSVASTPFGLLWGTATTISFTSNDDGVSTPAVAMPFGFDFFGSVYSTLYVHSNGYVSFSSGQPTGSPYVDVIPTAATPNNYIGGVKDDLNVTGGGTVTHFTVGSSPNRVFVVSYNNVKFYNTAANNGNASFQIQLFENDAHIEVHVADATDPVASAKVLGIENATGTLGYAAPGRNGVNWSVAPGTPEAWAFRPSGGSLTYSWSPAGDVVNPASATTLTNALSGTTAFTVTVSDGSCNVNGGVTVNVTAPITDATISGDLDYCAGGSTTLTAAPVDGAGPYTYLWSPNGEVTASINVTAPGNYDCLVSDACGGSVLAGTVTVVENALPTPTITPGGPVSFCGSGELTSSAASGNVWSPGGATTNSITVSSTGSYSVTVTDGNGCVGSSAPVAVTVNPQPTAVSVTPAGPEVICAGDSVDLAVSGGTYISLVSSNIDFGGSGSSTTPNTTGSTLGPNPMQDYYGGAKQQVVYRAADLTAMGLVSGSTINSIAINLSAVDATYNLSNYRVKAQWSSAITALTTTPVSTGWVDQFGPSTVTPAVGLNTFSFSAPMTWNGTDNLLVEFNYSNNNAGNPVDGTNVATYALGLAYNATSFYRVDNDTPTELNDYAMTMTAVYAGRNNVRINASVPTPTASTYTWSPNTSLTPNSGANVTAGPTSNTTYTVTATAPGGCTSETTVTVNMDETDSDGDDIIDCEDSCPNFPGVEGGTCDTNPGPLFSLGTITGCACVPVACTENVTMELRTDALSSQASWEILDQFTSTVICSFSIPVNGITTPITENCCLPAGCFRLRVMDSGGDGFVSGGITGGYQLRENGPTGRRIIDNFGNFTSGSVSAIASTYENGAFCVPIGDDKPIFTSCDKLDWVDNKFIVASPNADVTAQFGITNNTSGYEFWFFDPNGTYSFRRFRNHATSDGTGTGATRACHFRINGWTNTVSTPHIPANVLMNVRIRARVAGAPEPFGPACLFKIDAARAACPLTKLQDNAADADFSCGVSKTFGGANSASNKLVAAAPQFTPTVASTSVRYQFRFRIPGEYPAAGSCIVRPAQTSPTIYLNWTSGDKLKCNTQYQVDVRVSKDGGATWCIAGAEPTCSATPTVWGKVCNVNISTSTFCPGPAQGEGNNFAAEGNNGEFTMYPNPNRGDQLFLSLAKVADGVQTVSVDLFDMTGKRAMARTIAVQDGFLNTALDLNGDLAGGVYLVNITAGDKTYTQRLVIQP